MTPVLIMENISKSYGGVHALRGVRFDLFAGEVHALIGQNGAGKSTLIKVLSGAISPDGGALAINSRPVTMSSPADALNQGIGTVYQDPLVYGELTVVENIFMGREIRDRLGNIDNRAQVRRVDALLRDLDVDPGLSTRPIGSLSLALRQLALIAKAVSYDSTIMIFDEPTAILTQREADTLFAIIRKLRARGVGIIYISHRMEEIFSLADRVTVLKDGESKGTYTLSERAGARGEAAATDGSSVSSAKLIELMIGRELQESITNIGVPGEQPLLEVRRLTHAPDYREISFAVHPGEIVGFFGLVGAGRSEVARAIFGEEPASGGEILIEGRAVRIRTPGQAVKLGIAYLPEDRKGQGLFGNLSVGYNATITVVQRLAALGLFARKKREERVAQDSVRELMIKTPNTRIKVSNLSGGNQQKVVLAKWLAAKPRILLLDEPTAGIDVAAKQEIHNLIVQLARDGVAIMLISSELLEVLKLSDRVITMHEGKMTGEFPRGASASAVLSAAMETEVRDAEYTVA